MQDPSQMGGGGAPPGGAGGPGGPPGGAPGAGGGQSPDPMALLALAKLARRKHSGKGKKKAKKHK